MSPLLINILATVVSISVLIGGLLYLFYSMEKKSKERRSKKTG